MSTAVGIWYTYRAYIIYSNKNYFGTILGFFSTFLIDQLGINWVFGTITVLMILFIIQYLYTIICLYYNIYKLKRLI